MSSKTTPKTAKFHFSWRACLVTILVAVGLVSLIFFSVVHWTERQLLTTDNWVKIVGPLPKNNEVATALSDYGVTQLFEGVNVQQQISDVLPPKAAFLAPTLSTQLQSVVTKQAKNIVQSNAFTNLWVTANTAAHQKLMSIARSSTPPAKSKTTSTKLNLGSLEDKIKAKLGSSGSSLLSSSNESKNPSNSLSIGVKIKTGVNHFREAVHVIDFLDGTLGFFALICLVGAVTIAYRRRRVIEGIGILILVVGLSELIAVKVFRQPLLDQVQHSAYRPAVGVIYDSFTASFHKTALITTLIGLLVALIAFLTTPKLLNKNKWIRKKLADARKTTLYKRWQDFRQNVRQYRWYITGVAALITLVLLAFVFNPDPKGLLISCMILIMMIEIINLVSTRPRRLPMKQA